MTGSVSRRRVLAVRVGEQRVRVDVGDALDLARRRELDRGDLLHVVLEILVLHDRRVHPVHVAVRADEHAHHLLGELLVLRRLRGGVDVRVVRADDEDDRFGVERRDLLVACFGQSKKLGFSRPLETRESYCGLHDTGVGGQLAERRSERAGERVAGDPEPQRLVGGEGAALDLGLRAAGRRGSSRGRGRRRDAAGATRAVGARRGGSRR